MHTAEVDEAAILQFGGWVHYVMGLLVGVSPLLMSTLTSWAYFAFIPALPTAYLMFMAAEEQQVKAARIVRTRTARDAGQEEGE